MSGENHLRDLAPEQHSTKKRRSGGDPSATMPVHDLTGLEVEPLPLTPKAMSLPPVAARDHFRRVGCMTRRAGPILALKGIKLFISLAR